MSSKKRKKQKKQQLPKGTKNSLIKIIDDISIVIGRKGWPKEKPRKALTEALNKTDINIALLALILPEVDSLWRESAARPAFLKIKRRRQWIIRSLFAAAILGTIITLGLAALAVALMDHWAKWLILVFAIGLVVFGSVNIPPFLISPYITNYDLAIPTKYQTECQVIDEYVQKLIEINRNL